MNETSAAVATVTTLGCGMNIDPRPARSRASLCFTQNVRSEERTFLSGRYWDRTSDLFRVKEARYPCANRPEADSILAGIRPRVSHRRTSARGRRIVLNLRARLV